MSELFQPFDIEKASAVQDIDALPFGVIVVDRAGEMAGFSRDRVLGRNFFHDVAPCTAIEEFEGRFETFLTSHDTSIEPFEFVFPFLRGARRVTILFVRVNFISDRATICVARRPDGATERENGTTTLHDA